MRNPVEDALWIGTSPPRVAAVAVALLWLLPGCGGSPEEMPVAADPSLEAGAPAASDGRERLRYDREYPAIGYGTRRRSDRVAGLRERIAAGDVQLARTGARGHLDALLAALDIDVSSQVLVFSRTSVMVDGIRPERPRAIYFNEDSYVAWVQGSDTLEIAAMDPDLGPVFYTLAQDAGVTDRFQPQLDACLECHDSYSLTGGGVPRFLLGSGYTDASGELVSHGGWIVTSQRTPLRSRWGGWYVTGRHGRQAHLGNVVVRDPTDLQDLEALRRGNLDDLGDLLDTTPYPSDRSDIVALLVLEHQVTVQNALVRCSWDTRDALYRAARDGAEPPGPERIAALAEPLVEALLMVGEARISEPIAGTSGFREWFEARGRRDGAGRSLRELDLERRLFRHPLSYLVRSEAFDALPDVVRSRVLGRIAEILRGEADGTRYAHLSASDREAILQILAATKPEFAAAVGR